MQALNLNNISVDSNGRVSFGGLGTGIDIEGIVSSIIAAKQIPVDTINTRIGLNDTKIAALTALEGLLTGLRTSLSTLRGAISIGNTSNAFAGNQIFASTSRSDGATPSAAGNLLGASTTSAATVGSHDIQILRTATAHKVASNTFADKSTALSLSGTFEITGSGGSSTVTVAATDTLQDIRDRINNTNTGTGATKVSASIVQTSATEYILVVTSDETGKEMFLTDTGTVLSGLGISATGGSGAFRNGLADVDSKIDATSDGFKHIVFDGTQAENSFLISFDQATNVMTLTKGDGTTDTATLDSAAIAAGATETAVFSNFGATIVLDENFDKTTDILVDADAYTQVGTGAIDAATIQITDSTGNISGITSNTLTLDSTTPTAVSVTVGAFTGTFDGTGAIGPRTVVLDDGGGNTLTVQFDITAAYVNDETGSTITLNELKNAVGTTGAQFANQLQVEQTARFTADGLTDIDRFESEFVLSSVSTLASLAPTAGDPGAFNINVGGNSVLVNYLGTDTLSGLVTKINDAINGSGGAVETAGTVASLMTDGDGVRLVVTNTSGAAITFTDTDSLLAGLGVDNDLVIERDGNTVSDLFDGVTMNLFQAEEGTTVKIDIEQDLTTAKTAISNFVNSYNGLIAFINEQTQTDSTTGAAADDAGILFGSSALNGVSTSLSSVFSQATDGLNDAFKVLSQIGINFVDNSSITDPLLYDTLVIDDATLDEALLNNADDVRRLFAFDFSSSNPQVSLIDFSGSTSYSATGYNLNINFDDRYDSQDFTTTGAATQYDAVTGGPAADGITVAFDTSLASGNAYRYSYDTTGENLTLTNLTSGLSESISITTILDAIGDGGDLDGAETAAINFTSHDVTLTLDSTFVRATPIVTSGSLTVNATSITGTATIITDSNGGVTQAGLADLINPATVPSYDASTGIMTLNFTSSAVGNLQLAAHTGLEFSVDGNTYGNPPAESLVGGHTIDVRLSGTSEVIGQISLTGMDGTGVAGTLDFNMGEGMFAETTAVPDPTAPMSNYQTIADGTFQIKDSSNTLLGTVAYTNSMSLAQLAASITANVSNVTASVVQSGSTFTLDIIHATRDTLTFTETAAGDLLTQMPLTNVGDAVFSANIDGSAGGASDLTTTISGRSITVTSLSGAEDLKVFYNGSTDVDAIQLDFTTGFGARLYFAIDNMLTVNTGLIDSNIATLTTQNEVNTARADEMLIRLERTRQRLLQQFIRMETALATFRNIQDSLTQTFDAMFAAQSK